MDWNALNTFFAVAKTGSLSEAAKELRLSVATVGRKVDRLEQDFDGPLLVRGKTGAVLTPLGLSLYEEAGALREQFTQVRGFVSRQKLAQSQPVVRVSATEPLIADYLAPRLMHLKNNVRVDLIAETKVSNLGQVESDLAIRMFRPQESSLIARRIGTIALGWFASESYLSGRAAADIVLARERLLSISTAYGDIPEVHWVRQQHLEDNVICQSTSSRALLRAAQAGAGIAIGSRAAARQMGLIEIPTAELPSREVWLISARANQNLPRLSHVKNWISDAFKEGPS